jgi:pyruvate,water dikinase
VPEAQATAAPELRSRHEALRDLLDRNGVLLELLAEIQLDLRLLVPGDPVVRTRALRILDATLLQAQTLNVLADDRYRGLYAVHARLEDEIRRVLDEERRRLHSDPIVVPLSACRAADQSLVGGKASRLGELLQSLPDRVPEGFVVTTAACGRLLAHGETGGRLRELMRGLDLVTDDARLGQLAAEARGLLARAPIPDEVAGAIRQGAAALPEVTSWAVRSSAVGEDGPFSFAGQFETRLHVPGNEIVSAWRQVVASTFSEHALRYRLACGLFELTTPMAVLVMPMVGARSAGVLYTRDPARPDEDTLLVSAVRGLAPDVVGGLLDAETALVARGSLAVRERVPGSLPSALSDDDLARLARLGLEAESIFQEALDVEWAMDGGGRPRLLQARPLVVSRTTPIIHPAPSSPVARGGRTVVGGRAVGPVSLAPSAALPGPDGSVMVVRQALPELGHLLPRVEGLVAEQGSVAGHLASLAREFGVPSVFGMPEVTTRLAAGETVSLDATSCQVHRGVAWPVEGRAARKQARERRSASRSPLHRLLLHLDLTDPRASSFQPRGCHSLHDIIRLCHERGVAALFEGGGWREGSRAGALRLRDGPLADGAWVLDAGGGLALPEEGARGDVEPRQVLSRPFHALWRGMTAPGITWSGRRNVDLRGLASVVASSLTRVDGDAASLDATAYLIVAMDYVNFNARMAYHFAMVDSVVGEIPESNEVSFRFWGGGAGRAQRDLRAVFLAEVLERSAFTVERRGDLVTARLRRAPAPASEAGLELLGRLMGCARQLDMLLHSESQVTEMVESFFEGRYERFA